MVASSPARRVLPRAEIRSREPSSNDQEVGQGFDVVRSSLGYSLEARGVGFLPFSVTLRAVLF